ncbi:galactose-1-phosphate uridylyltransferase [Patescibacteria group bacterium]
MSELRRDLITDRWVDIATVRAKRPDAFVGKAHTADKHDKGRCVFCPGNEEIVGDELFVTRDKGKPNDRNWKIRVVPNKFPSFAPLDKLDRRKVGPYSMQNASGKAEVVLMRDRNKFEAQMTAQEVGDLILAYRERYRDLADDKHINYILIFKNHGKQAGASIAHPHSQIYALPIISDAVQDELTTENKYFKTHKKSALSAAIQFEKRNKKRIVFENKDFIVFCPFASSAPFEMRVAPKKYEQRFEDIKDSQLELAGEALHKALKGLYYGLKNPPFNYYIHSAPAMNKNFPGHHWHLRIIPRLAIRAGFELGTGIIVNPVKPETAAAHLRKFARRKV